MEPVWIYSGDELKRSGLRRVEAEEYGPKKRRRVKVWPVGRKGHPETVTPETFKRLVEWAEAVMS